MKVSNPHPLSLSLHQKHKVDLFYKVRHVMMELIDLRRQLLSGHLTQDQSRDVKRHITDGTASGSNLGFNIRPKDTLTCRLGEA